MDGGSTWEELPPRGFGSIDGESTWEELPYRGVGASIIAVSIDDPLVAYVPAYSFGANYKRRTLRTLDGGRTWQVRGRNPYLVALVAASRTTAYGLTDNGTLFATTNGGRLWKRLRSAPANLTAIALDPNDTTRIYVSDSEANLHTSHDSGRSWELLRPAPPLPALESNFPHETRFIIDPGTPQVRVLTSAGLLVAESLQ
jgi:hypothetical protein